METKHLSERLVNYDILRIFAAYLIVMLHFSVQYINKAPVSIDEYFQWKLAIIFSAFSRVGVPIFVMLSGAFLLNPDKNITLNTIFKKYLPKLIAIFVFWSFFYSLTKQDFFINLTTSSFSDNWNTIDWDKFWPYFTLGHYHMWYLYLLAGLYLITPLLKHITAQATKTQLTYFVLLCILITSVTKLNQGLWNIPLLDMVLNKLSLSFCFGYIGYFVGGYLLSAYTPGWRISSVVFVLGILSLKLTCQETWALNPVFGFDKPNLVYFSNYSPTVFIMSFALFLLTTKLKFIKLWNPLQRLASHLPKYMLVVYLIHPFVIKQCRVASILLPTESAWSLPKNAFIIYILSLAISIILMQVYQLVFSAFKFIFESI